MELQGFQKETYPSILNEFIEKMTTDRKAEKTIINYSNWISNFIQFMKYTKYKHGNEEIKDVNIANIQNSLFNKIGIDDIEQFKKYLSEQGNNGNSINRKLAASQTFYKFLVQKKIIDSNIFFNVDRVKQTEKVRNPLSKEEVEKLLKTIKNSSDNHKEMYYFLFLLYLDVGARCTEITKLKMEQIYNNEYLLLHGKGDKDRNVFMNSNSILALNSYLIYREDFLKSKNINSEYLFVNKNGNKLDENTVLLNLKKFAKEAGLNDKEISPHVLRHTSATLKYNYGGADLRILQEFLGHTSINTTERYVKVSNDKRKNLANCVNLDL
ncbi:tyrosine-type recombinase/integrase [Clostridium sp.]|uniref:tyrosine-type recombinase/integrase n=1 Tax=Clostridium sp. TaxID=1506 RepID=UPI002613E9F0|nr:tyrosine-type recombinase/integrase [Clostridium sp.]